MTGALNTHKITPDAHSHRQTCATCHAAVCNDHSAAFGFIDVCGGVLDGPHAFDSHLWYSEHVVDFSSDGKPKYQNMPAAFGGSGELYEEAK